MLLAGLCLVIPYILTIVLIIVTGDRYDGMTYASIPGLLSAQFIFGLIFIKKKGLSKIVLCSILTALTFGLVWVGMTMEIIKTGLDSYQFWDLAITNLIAGIIIWELFYQINNRVRPTVN